MSKLKDATSPLNNKTDSKLNAIFVPTASHKAKASVNPLARELISVDIKPINHQQATLFKSIYILLYMK